jgi:hypothetical protein
VPELPFDPEPVPELEPPLDAEPLELGPLPEPERSSALPPHEKTRQTAMAAATKEASVIAVVRGRLTPVLSRLWPPAAQNGARGDECEIENGMNPSGRAGDARRSATEAQVETHR